MDPMVKQLELGVCLTISKPTSQSNWPDVQKYESWQGLNFTLWLFFFFQTV